MDREAMRNQLKKKLSPKRFEHSVGVSYIAASLAMVHGIDVEKALVAGLLHDCAKYLSPEKKIKKCKQYDLPILPCEMKNPELLHAKLSAVYAREKYDVTDEEILSSITWHTTGKPNMSMLDKIVYIADYIEPNRKPLPEIEEIRKEAYFDIDKCLLHILSNCITFLEASGGEIDPITKETYDYYNQ